MGLVPFTWNVEKRKKKKHIWKIGKKGKKRKGEVVRHAEEHRIPVMMVSVPLPFLF